MDEDPVRLSQEYLSALRDREPTGEYRERIAELDLGELAADDRKKAFWTNVYNARAQELVASHPVLYHTRLLYILPVVHVAGHRVSLNTIQHGFLRRSRLSIGRGYIRQPLVSGFQHRMRVDDLDPRVHFALNTGARDSPPIRFLSASHADHELDRATTDYLDEEVIYRPNSGTVHIPRQFHRFRGDFGGTDGIISFLQHHGQVPDHARPSIRFTSYDRSRAPHRFVGG